MSESPDPRAAIAQRLKELHAACGHPSYAEIGRLAGLPKTTVSDKINGLTFPGREQFRDLVAALRALADDDLGCDPVEIDAWYMARNREQAEIRSKLARASQAQRRADSYGPAPVEAVVDEVPPASARRRRTGQLVRALRNRARMTQEELSYQSGVGVRTIRRLETDTAVDVRLTRQGVTGLMVRSYMARQGSSCRKVCATRVTTIDTPPRTASGK